MPQNSSRHAAPQLQVPLVARPRNHHYRQPRLCGCQHLPKVPEHLKSVASPGGMTIRSMNPRIVERAASRCSRSSCSALLQGREPSARTRSPCSGGTRRSSLQVRPLLIQPGQLGLPLDVDVALPHPVQDLQGTPLGGFEVAWSCGQPPAVLCTEAVRLGDRDSGELTQALRGQESHLEGVEHASLDLRSFDHPAVRADRRSRGDIVVAPQIRSRLSRETTSADATLCEFGEQELGAPRPNRARPAAPVWSRPAAAEYGDGECAPQCGEGPDAHDAAEPNRLISSDERLKASNGGDVWADQPYLSRSHCC